MKAIDKAVYDKMKATAALTGATTGIYNSIAPQDTALPYLVFTTAAGVPALTFDSQHEDNIYQLDIYAGTPEQANTILNHLDTALNLTVLTISGYSHVLSRRVNQSKSAERVAGDAADMIYRISADYRVLAHT